MPIERPVVFTRFRIAFKMFPQGLFAWAIRLFAGAPVHVELIFNEGVSFSAGYERDNGIGTRFTNTINFSVPGVWKVIELDPALAEKAFAFCVREQGCGYDFLGILCGWTLGLRPSPTRWFCSEVCAAALQYADPLLLGVGPAQWYTPKRLWADLTAPRPTSLVT